MAKNRAKRNQERLASGNPNSRDKRRELRANKDNIEGPWKMPKYCYFSAAHKADMIARRPKYHEVFYRLLNGEIVEITEVFTDPNIKPQYDDAICLGQGHHHYTSKEPIVELVK